MHSGQQQFINLIKGKKVLYIATKNADYIRIVQEIKLLKENASHVQCIVSKNKSYIKRILHVYKELLFTSSKDSTNKGVPYFFAKLSAACWEI